MNTKTHHICTIVWIEKKLTPFWNSEFSLLCSAINIESIFLSLAIFRYYSNIFQVLSKKEVWIFSKKTSYCWARKNYFACGCHAPEEKQDHRVRMPWAVLYFSSFFSQVLAWQVVVMSENLKNWIVHSAILKALLDGLSIHLTAFSMIFELCTLLLLALH